MNCDNSHVVAITALVTYGHHLSVTIFIYMLPHLQATTSPVSSEISDLCEISDLLLFISYFASQNKGKSLAITFFICVV